MFPTFISILDIQSWWEVPSIAHFCSLFRTAFNLLDFDIEDLEEALLTDGTEESSWLQELIVRLLSGCLPNNEISTFNYQMFLRRLFRQKCQEHDRYNPFNTDCDFTLLPLRTKVDILHALCDFRLDAEDVLDQLKNLEADSLRVEPLGYDSNDSAYWYFYGTRLYREDFQKKNNKKKSIWQVICFTEDDWFQLTKKVKNSTSKAESALYHTLSKNFLPELPRLFKEKERQARRRLLENQPRRTSDRIRKLDIETTERQETEENQHLETEQAIEGDTTKKRIEQENRRKESYERRSKLKEESEEESQSEQEPEERHEMVAKRRGRGRQRKASTASSDNGKEITPSKRKKTRSTDHEEPSKPAKPATVGRQTNNSLSAADGQIVLLPAGSTTTSKKKLKTSQVNCSVSRFQQTDEDLQVGMHKILDYVKNHEDAWPFVEPVEEEYAPNYYSIIRRPMDLTRMEDRLDQGTYKTFDKFKSDFQLIVNNCRLYNGVENEYTEMVDNLLKVFDKATERYLDQISSSDEEIAVENLNSECDSPDAKIVKHSKKKKHSESPPRTSNRGRKPALAAQGKKRTRSPSDESEKSLEEEIVEEKPKKSKKQEKDLKKASKVSKKIEKVKKESKKSDKDTSKKSGKEMKKSDKEIKENKKVEREVKESRNNDKSTKENKKSDKEIKESRKTDKDTKENKKNEKEVKESSKRPEKESKKHEKEPKESKINEKDWKESKKEDSKRIEEDKKSKKLGKNSKSKKDKIESKKENKVKEKDSKPKKRGRKKKKATTERSRSKSFSTRSPSPSPVRSVLSTPPPSSPDCRDFAQRTKQSSKEPIEAEDPVDPNKSYPWEVNPYFSEEPPPYSPKEKKTVEPIGEDFPTQPPLPFAFKPAKDKHNKLRETIEKLKAKSEISRIQPPVYDFEADDHLKENKDKNKKVEKEEKAGRHKVKEKQPLNKSKKPHDDIDDGNSSQTEMTKKSGKKKEHQSKVPDLPPPVLPKQSNFDALSLATEQTLKDINKWLDDTPKFADFSSASNSPSYLALDDFDLLGTPKPEPKKVEKVPVSIAAGITSNVPGLKKDGSTVPMVKEGKKKPFRDPSKFFNKRREVQRTIDRLQPGKGKGNLITNVQNTPKPDEIFPLGPLSKMKDTKNSLIVKTDTNAPKLSLGSVLDSFGKHRFVDDPKKDEEEEKVDTEKVEEVAAVEPKVEEGKEEKKPMEVGAKVEKDIKETKPAEEPSPGGPTPNLSAWFKAFGAPKAPPPQKKSDSKPDAKDEESTAKSERVPVPDPSPSLDSPQPVARQRRISTGSSMSERSSFSQDLDSPRVGMDERGAYPAPYPSPLHRSPSGVSPVMASPRPDISPRSAYPFNGQMRVGFYQDTVSNKSSPDKSCSPRETPQSTPYYPPSDHVYAPNTTQNSVYSYANTPYYTHPPNYSSTNPTPPYNMDGSSSTYYDTSKVGTEQYQSKPSQNYTANSPASSQASPAAQPLLSPHSPIVHSQPSPSLHSQQSSVHSPSMHSPSVHSPSMHSPNVNSPSMHSPSMHSPSIHSQHSPSVNSPQLHSPNPGLHSPSLSVHSPQMSVVSPQMTAMSPQMSAMSPQMSVVSPQVNSPGLHSPMGVNSPHHSQVHSPINPPSVEQFHAQQEDGSNSGGGDSIKGQQNSNQNQPVFPVKKRAFLDNDLSQFAALQEELVNRNLQMGHQLSLTPSTKPEAEMKQPLQAQQQHLLQQQLQQQMQKQQQQLQKQQMQKQQEEQLQQVQNQLLQQAQLQQQKSQQLLQQAHLQQQVQMQQQQQQKSQQQQLQKSQQQNQQQLQKNQQLHQQQATMYSKPSDSSLRTPSPPIQQQIQPAAMSQQQMLSHQQAVSQQQQGQRGQQQVAAHSNNESTPASIRNMYPPVTSQSNPYNSNYANREAFPLNIPSAHSMHQQQPKLDMSKFTNMGYTGPEVNFSRALQQQYGRPELSYTRTTVQSAISQASQLLNSQSLTANQPSASSASSLPGYQKPTTNQQQAHSGNYQSNRSVDSVAERLAAQQEAAASYKPDMSSSRSNYNSSSMDLDQALGLSRNISNLPNIVDRYTNEQRMIAGLQSSSNPYYTDKGLGTSHMFNKTMSQASQIFSQANMAAMSSYTQSMQQTSAASMYNRQINELQQAAQAAQTHPDLKSSAQAVAQDRKNRKKKSGAKSGTTSDSTQVNSSSNAPTASAASASAQGFQSYAGLKGPPSASSTPTLAGTALEPGAISLKTSSVVPGSAFNFGPAASGALGLGSGLYGDKDTYSNFLEDFRTAPNFYMAAAAAHHRSTPEGGASGKGTQSGASSQSYPSFLNPAHQSRPPGYPLGGPFIPPSAQAQLMDTSSQLYQHYLQAGVLNQGLLGAPGAYPPGYHPLAMRQPYDSMSRPSWL